MIKKLYLKFGDGCYTARVLNGCKFECSSSKNLYYYYVLQLPITIAIDLVTCPVTDIRYG